jgi:hypothetical protein
MTQNQYLLAKRAEWNASAKRKQALARCFAALGYAFLVCLFGAGFALFGWITANVEAPILLTDPSWFQQLWSLSMGGTALACFVLAGYFLFAFLDEALLPKHDTRRITRRR